MKLHWSPKSPYVRKVMILIHELNALSDLELIRSVAAMTQPNLILMKDNPLSKIPTLVLSNGMCLFDSIVICEYLNNRYGGNFFPQNESDKWPSLRWQALGDGFLDALILWRNEREREIPLASLIEAFELKTSKVLAVLESEVQLLYKSPFTIGIVSIACALGYLDYRFQSLNWRQRAPLLSKWFELIEERSSFKKTIAIEG